MASHSIMLTDASREDDMNVDVLRPTSAASAEQSSKGDAAKSKEQEQYKLALRRPRAPTSNTARSSNLPPTVKTGNVVKTHPSSNKGSKQSSPSRLGIELPPQQGVGASSSSIQVNYSNQVQYRQHCRYRRIHLPHC